LARNEVLWILLAGASVTGGLCAAQTVTRETAAPQSKPVRRAVAQAAPSAPVLSRALSAKPGRSATPVASPMPSTERLPGTPPLSAPTLLDGLPDGLGNLGDGSGFSDTNPPSTMDYVPGGVQGGPEFGNSMARTPIQSSYPRIREALRNNGYGSPGEPNPVLQAAIAASRAPGGPAPRLQSDAQLSPAEAQLAPAANPQKMGAGMAKPPIGLIEPSSRRSGRAFGVGTSRSVGAGRQAVGPLRPR
jgi:hypothetical protein